MGGGKERKEERVGKQIEKPEGETGRKADRRSRRVKMQ